MENELMYLTFFIGGWSLSKQGYLQFLKDGSIDADSWDLADPKYEAIHIGAEMPEDANPIEIADLDEEDFKNELEYFLKTGKQSGWKKELIEIEKTSSTSEIALRRMRRYLSGLVDHPNQS